jgi:hypothetical protein
MAYLSLYRGCRVGYPIEYRTYFADKAVSGVL